MDFSNLTFHFSRSSPSPTDLTTMGGAAAAAVDGLRVGAFQRSGPMTVAPLFGPDAGRRFLPPLTGLKLSRVAGYGNVEVECRSTNEGGVAIVPLHIGYIQDKAQNHAFCRSGFVGAGQKRMFDDACCVQQAQGGYLEGRDDQWFFVLPAALRDTALRMRGTKDFRKLWEPIAKLNAAMGLPARGHLEHIICHDRYYLTQYASRFELCEGQTGALFFMNDKLVGVELAPNAAYFAETWMPLVCFSYGSLAKQTEEKKSKQPRPRAALTASTLDELRNRLLERRHQAGLHTISGLSRLVGWRTESKVTEEERYLDLRMSTIEGPRFSGQMVTTDRDGRIVYLSLAATEKELARGLDEAN